MKKRFSILNSHFSIQRGQTLIEAVGALAVISLVISAIAIAVTTSLNNAQFNKNQSLATKYAQQGIEIVRQIRNSNYISFASTNGTYCLGKGQTSLGTSQSNCNIANVDTFIRSVQIEQNPGCGANVARVTVTVSFIDGKCQSNTYCHKQTEITCLSTVNPVQAP